MSVDGMFVFVLIQIPFYIWVMATAPDTYSLNDYIFVNLHILCILGGGTLLSNALRVGKAGHVAAIDNLKTVWQTVMTVLIAGEVPTSTEVIGCICGIAGAMFIVLGKKTEKK